MPYSWHIQTSFYLSMFSIIWLSTYSWNGDGVAILSLWEEHRPICAYYEQGLPRHDSHPPPWLIMAPSHPHSPCAGQRMVTSAPGAASTMPPTVIDRWLCLGAVNTLSTDEMAGAAGHIRVGDLNYTPLSPDRALRASPPSSLSRTENTRAVQDNGHCPTEHLGAYRETAWQHPVTERWTDGE